MPKVKRAKSTKSKLTRNQKFFLVVGLAALLAFIAFFLNKPEEEIAPPVTPSHPTLVELRADGERAKLHELQTVREAAELFLILIDRGEASHASCPGIRVIGNSGNLDMDSTAAMAVKPDVGFDEKGAPFLYEIIGVEIAYWHQIPTTDRWAYIWHEMQHVLQDCQLLYDLLQAKNYNGDGEELWQDFDRHWNEAEVEKEAMPLAVQAYWQQHGFAVQVFPAIEELMRLSPGAWQNTLPLREDGVPLGITQQTEWPAWVQLVGQVYVIE